MAKKLSDFLIWLAEKPERQIKYVEHMEDMLANSGLKEEHKKLLRTGDLEPIRQALQGDVGGSTTVFAVIRVITGVIRSST